MPPPSTALEALLDELQKGAVSRERYSRRSFYGRVEPLLLTTGLACVAVVGGVVLCEASAERPRR